MNKIILSLTMAGALLVVPVARAQSAGAERDQGASPMQQAEMTRKCPMKVEGTSLEVADTPDGIAVTFISKAARAVELQIRVARMAAMHEAMPSDAAMQERVIAGAVRFEALPNGARLTLTPKDPAKLKAFREQVRLRVEPMKKGDCSMMNDMMMKGKMSGMEKPDADKSEADHRAHRPPGQQE